MTKRVLVTYPNGTESVAEAIKREEYLSKEEYTWIRGHGDMETLITQQGCTVVPLIAITTERIEALEEILPLAQNWCSQYHTHYFGNVRTEECSEFETMREMMKEAKL